MRRCTSRSLSALVLFLFAATVLSAQSGMIVYAIDGRLASISSNDELGLSGAQFRFTVAIDAAAPAKVERSVERETAVYESGISRLEIREASNPRLNGVYRAGVERLVVTDTYASDFCVEFGSVFGTSAGSVTMPAACFKAGSARGTALPTAEITSDVLAGFRPVVAGGASYAIQAGAIRVEGGRR